jgi:hypothetical protein
MLRPILIALLLLLIAAAAVFAWPLSTVLGLKQALESRDADGVARRVDFAVLKANVKRAAHQQIENKESGTVLAPVKDAVIEVIADDKLDDLATPEGLIHRACDQPSNGAAADSSEDSSKPCQLHGQVRHFDFQSSRRFEVSVHPQNGKPFTLVMARRGWHWWLVDLVYTQSDASKTVH